MAKKEKHAGKGLVIKVGVGMILLSVLLSVGAAKLILMGVVSEEAVRWMTLLIGGIVSMLMSRYCAKRVPGRKLLWGMIAAMGYIGMLLIANLLLFGSGYEAMAGVSCSILSGGFLGSLLCPRKSKKRT